MMVSFFYLYVSLGQGIFMASHILLCEKAHFHTEHEGGEHR